MSETVKTRPRSNATTEKPVIVPPEQIKWVQELTGAKAKAAVKNTASAARKDAISLATLEIEENREKIREGMTFEMDKISDPAVLARLKKAFGVKNTMKSLDGSGDAMKEIDTEHDLTSLKAISGIDLSKAYKAMEIMSNTSQATANRLREARFTEAGYDQAQVTKLEAAAARLEERKAAKKDGKPIPPRSKDDPPDTELEKFAKTSGEIDELVDRDVANEVWTPLVRQGVIPENLVPDRYSDVNRTFKAASAHYMEQLEEYSKGLDENHNLLAKLGVGKEIVSQCSNLGSSIIAALPIGATDIKAHVTLASDLFAIVSATGFTVAEQAIKQSDAQDIVDTIANAAADICKAAIPDPTIASIVSTSIKGGIAAGRAVRGIVDKKPEAFLDSLSAATQAALNSAYAATGIADLKTIGPMVVGAIKSSGSAAKFIKACRDGDVDAMKEAAGELTTNAMNTLASCVKGIVDDRAKSLPGGKTEAGTIDTAVDIGSAGLGALVTAALSEDKAKGVSKALGTIANSACGSFIQPASLGKSIGTLIDSAVSGAGDKLVTAIKNRDPGPVLDLLADLVGKSLATAAADPKNAAVADKLKKAAGWLANSVKSLTAANALRKAIKSGSMKDIQDASQGLFNSISAHISQALPSSDETPDDDDATDDADAGDDGDDGEDKENAETEDAKEADEDVINQLRDVIAEADKVMEGKGTEAEKAKAAKAKAAAIKEIVDQNLMKSELAAEGTAFAATLSDTFGEQNDDPDYEGEGTKKLQQLILELQKDRKIFELIETLSSMPLQVAAKFFPPAGAALDFKKFTFEVAKAVQHTKALLEWMDNAADARAAVTVQVHAMLSRVGMETRQVVEHNMRAALALTAAIGQVVAAVGAHAAPIGVAMTTAARIGKSALEIIKKVADESEMAAAWSKFKAAMRNPKDRKAARQAIQSNPTLAKYTLAWGALKNNDPIAREALRKCGLTDAVLSQEGANVKDVQAYLQEMFNEDLVVLRAVPVPKAWYPSSKAVFTLRSWNTYLAAAITKGKLAAGSGGGVSQAFTAFDRLEESLKRAQKAYQSAADAVAKEDLRLVKLAGMAAANDIDAGDLDPNKKLDKLDLKTIPNKPPEADMAVKQLLTKRATVQKARLDAIKNQVVAAAGAVQTAARSCTPLDAEGNLLPEVREYLDSVVALGELRQREFKGQVVALDLSDAA